LAVSVSAELVEPPAAPVPSHPRRTPVKVAATAATEINLVEFVILQPPISREPS
jgi:hypothetical protein